MNRRQCHETANKITYIKGKITDSLLSPLRLIGFGHLNALQIMPLLDFIDRFFYRYTAD
jgi:hypothetical protein